MDTSLEAQRKRRSVSKRKFTYYVGSDRSAGLFWHLREVSQTSLSAVGLVASRWPTQ
ncbi:hypothetical protein bas30_0114 [Escherichia phage TrudiRoth]|uniref:Uncharacterized protein n=1 Tax=Escherichia phage TrudiRoth TaxID=2851994 RepID=A0AAE7W100_9CAUD|nr:hypothetical protein bas30_0114 [Escherichia phage TrudiRoth]